MGIPTDYRAALVQCIRVMRCCDQQLRDVPDAWRDWIETQNVAAHGAGVALARLGGLGAAW